MPTLTAMELRHRFEWIYCQRSFHTPICFSFIAHHAELLLIYQAAEKNPPKKHQNYANKKKVNNVNYRFAHRTVTHLSCSTAAAVYAWTGLNATESNNERDTSNVHTLSVCMYCTSDKFHVGKQRWQTQSWSRTDTRRVRQLGWQKEPRTQYTHTSTHTPGSGE